MADEHQHSFLDLLQESETMASNLSRSLITLSSYVNAAGEHDATRVQGFNSIRLLILNAQDRSRDITTLLKKTRAEMNRSQPGHQTCWLGF